MTLAAHRRRPGVSFWRKVAAAAPAALAGRQLARAHKPERPDQSRGAGEQLHRGAVREADLDDHAEAAPSNRS